MLNEISLMKIIFSLLYILLTLFACTENKKGKSPFTASENPADTTITHYRFSRPQEEFQPTSINKDTIVDADYSFEEAISGTGAPREIIDQLALFEVFYLSTDGRIHRGQILSNKIIAGDIRTIFRFMMEEEFVVEKAIPIVKYNWNDSLSMNDNNSYSFCYRNTSYSKHATGMAIDINPRFNPVRWKTEKRPNQPERAVSDTTVNGTFHSDHPVVNKFRKLGFRWGHSFTKYYDDHHFEKR